MQKGIHKTDGDFTTVRKRFNRSGISCHGFFLSMACGVVFFDGIFFGGEVDGMMGNLDVGNQILCIFVMGWIH